MAYGSSFLPWFTSSAVSHNKKWKSEFHHEGLSAVRAATEDRNFTTKTRSTQKIRRNFDPNFVLFVLRSISAFAVEEEVQRRKEMAAEQKQEQVPEQH